MFCSVALLFSNCSNSSHLKAINRIQVTLLSHFLWMLINSPVIFSYFLISSPLTPSQLPLSQCNPFVSELPALISGFPSALLTPTTCVSNLPAHQLPFPPAHQVPCSLPAAQYHPDPGLLLPGDISHIFFTDFFPALTLKGTHINHPVFSISKCWFPQTTPGVWHN